MAEVFDHYSRYYDLLYQDKDYEGETEYVCKLIHRFQHTAKTILELGSGTGRHAELLSARGLHVTGVERSPQMFKIASERSQRLLTDVRGTGFSIHQGDARSFRIDQHFDTVISLFHVASYQVTNVDILNLFQTANYHLLPGGCFVFDAWYGPAVLAQQPAIRIKRLEDDAVDVLRIAEPSVNTYANRVDVQYTMFVRNKVSGMVEQFTESHPMRYYFPLELDLIADQSGFEIIHSEEWMSGSAPSEQTWGVAFAARKIASAGCR